MSVISIRILCWLGISLDCGQLQGCLCRRCYTNGGQRGLIRRFYMQLQISMFSKVKLKRSTIRNYVEVVL